MIKCNLPNLMLPNFIPTKEKLKKSFLLEKYKSTT